jgi:thiamine kinase-like enzyme
MKFIRAMAAFATVFSLSGTLLSYSFGDFTSFGGSTEKLRRFDELLGPTHRLTVGAIAYWLKEDQQLGPSFFDSATGMPVSGKLVISELKDAPGAFKEEVWQIKAAAHGPLKPVFIVKVSESKRCENEAHGLQEVNAIVSREKWGNKTILGTSLPKLALLESVLSYEGPHARKKCILLLHAAPGEQCLLEAITQVEKKVDSNAIACLQNIGRALGAMHSAFAADASVPIDEMKTLIHGDINSGNIFFDKERKRITFIDNSAMRFGNPMVDLESCLGGLHLKAFVLLGRIKSATERLAGKSPCADEKPLSPETQIVLRKQIDKNQVYLDRSKKLVNVFIDSYAAYFPRESAKAITAFLVTQFVSSLTLA